MQRYAARGSLSKWAASAAGSSWAGIFTDLWRTDPAFPGSMRWAAGWAGCGGLLEFPSGRCLVDEYHYARRVQCDPDDASIASGFSRWFIPTRMWFISGPSEHLSEEQKQLLQDLAQITDFKATSDPPAWLTDVERAALGEFLDRRASVRKTSRTTYELDGRSVDFSAQTGMPPLSGPITDLMGAVIGGLANVPFLMKIFDLAELRT